MLIAAPTVGSFVNEYAESEVLEQGQKILDALRDADNRLLVREIAAVFDASSIPAQSKRSDGELMSIYSKSVLWKRQTGLFLVQSSHHR